MSVFSPRFAAMRQRHMAFHSFRYFLSLLYAFFSRRRSSIFSLSYAFFLYFHSYEFQRSFLSSLLHFFAILHAGYFSHIRQHCMPLAELITPLIFEASELSPLLASRFTRLSLHCREAPNSHLY